MKILAALDGSDCSRAVIDHCLKCKWSSEDQFKLISVVDFFEPLPALEGLKKKEIDSARQLLESETARLMKTFPQLNVSYRVLDGYVKTQVVDEARDWGADLILLGSHGRTGLKRLLLGSVSTAVLYHSGRTVRIVRPAENASESGYFDVFLPMDDSKFSLHSLERLLSYSWPENVRFTLMSVVFPLPEAPDAPDSQRFQLEDRKKKLKEEAVHLLESAKARIEDKLSVKSETKLVVVLGNARDEILKYLEEHPPELVIMGSHGRGAFDQALMGSVSDAVVNHAGCSVEIVRL